MRIYLGYAFLALVFTACSQQQRSFEAAPSNNGISYAIVTSAADVATCPTGGTVFNTFADLNRNGTLDSGEVVVSTVPVCNGAVGAPGAPSPDQTARFNADEALLQLNFSQDSLLAARVTALEALTTSIDSRLTVVEGAQTSLTTSVTNLQSQVGTLSLNISTLSDQTTTQYNLLTTSLNSVTTNLATLTSTVNNLGAQVGTNTTSIASQLAQISALQVQMSTANSAIASLQSLVASLQGKTVEIVNTCGNEKLERISGKLYGVYHSVTTATIPVDSVGATSVLVASCSTTNGNGGCTGDMHQVSVTVPATGSLTYINSVASFWSEIPNGSYVTTDTNNNPNGTGCHFTVLNGNVIF